MNKITKIVTFLYLFIFVCLVTTKAQTSSGSVLIPGQLVSGERKELVSINGIPAIKYVCKDGWSSLVYFQKRNDEKAFAVPVWHIEGLKYDRGWLYISSKSVAYVPDEEKSDGFDVLRSDVKNAQSVSTGMWNPKNRGSYLKMEVKGKVKNFWIYFDGAPKVANRLGLGGSFQKPVLEFIDRMMADFDKATQEFQQLTTGLDVSSAPLNFGVVTTPAEIREKYDRFKDLTTIETSVMKLLSIPDESYSVGISVSFIHKGKMVVLPESVTMKFHINSMQSMFLKEEDRTVIFLIDEERFNVGTLRLDSEDTAATNTPSANLKNVVSKSTWSLTIQRGVFEKIMNAQKVEMQIGNIETQFNGQHLIIFKNLLSPSKLPPIK